MILQNKKNWKNNWFYSVTILPCILLLISCVPTTYESTTSSNVRPIDAYNEIKSLYERLSTSSDQTDAEMFIDKSKEFIKAYPKNTKADEIYFVLGQTLLQFDRADEAITILDELIKYYPVSSYIGESLLILGLAYDNVGKHDKADQTYGKLLSDARFSGSKNQEAAQQLLETDRKDRKGALTELSGGSAPLEYVGKKAIDFQVVGLDGQAFSLKKYKGKIVLLDFWATWSPACITEMPNLKRIYAKFQNKNFIIIGISLDRGIEPLKSYISSEGITWLQYFDNSNQIANIYGITHIPTTFLIDGKGIIKAINLRGAALEAAISQLVLEESFRFEE